jgi:hypothetical protein
MLTLWQLVYLIGALVNAPFATLMVWNNCSGKSSGERPFAVLLTVAIWPAWMLFVLFRGYQFVITDKELEK